MPAGRWSWMLLVIGLAACAPQRTAIRADSECQRDREVVALCGSDLCAVVPQGPGGSAEQTPTQAVAVRPAPLVGPAPVRLGTPYAPFLPGDKTTDKALEAYSHPDPPEAKYPLSVRAVIETVNKEPHVKHHIFPQAFKSFSKEKGINVHDWVLIIPLDDHKRIHRGERGGPWNADWKEWIEKNRIADKEAIFRFAGEMVYRYCL